MGVRIFVGHENGSDHEQAVLFCSGLDRVFGPFFESVEEAGMFLEWLSPRDARGVPVGDLEFERYKFLRERKAGWKTREETLLEEEREEMRLEEEAQF